ncbi:MAG: hypothetical protein HN566_12900 [Polaribacter sp.]|nr:hypothetical protein [Polaribacter sp.]
MGIVDKVMKGVGWKPPSSKQSGITDADTLYSDKTIRYVKMYYDEDVRVINVHPDGSIPNIDLRYNFATKNTRPGKVDIKGSYYLDGSREKDLKYNDDNAPLQIHCFGDSWTYGWDIKQEETFVHLLGDENTAVYNYGAGKTGLDYAVKKITEVYDKFNHRENQNFIYVITIPHSFRRMHFEDNGTARRTWDKPNAAEVNEYNHFLYLYHHYEILNRLIGREKIIWGTWDAEIPKDMIDVFFDLHDYAGRHPGPESHRLYADQIRNIMKKNGWYNQQS